MMYAVIDEATGEILRQTGQPPGIEMPDGISDESHYYDILAEEFISRPTLGIADTINMTAGNGLYLSVPMGTRATIMGQVAMCSDGSLDILIDTQDEYTLHLYPPFPYIPQYVKLVVG